MVLVQKHLRAFFGRDGLLDRIGKNLAEEQAGSDVHIGGREKAVGEIMNGIDVKTRAALVGMIRIDLGPEDSILDRIETRVEERARIRARAQIAADTDTALREQVSAQGEICRAAQSQVVSLGNAKPLLAGSAEGRRQKT